MNIYDPDIRRALSLSFDCVWRVLAAAGICDEIDGEEYYRVRHEWLKRFTIRQIVEYIRYSANAPTPPAAGESAPTDAATQRFISGSAEPGGSAP